ncbi:MAG: MATE family efflux transporter, partial [Sulfitobacter sp.]
AILRAHGDARRAMMATIYGGLVNAILDPILIFGFDLELTGAALASVAARLVIAGTAMLPIIQHYGGIGRPNGMAMLRDLPPIAAIAVPAILTQLATPVGLAFVTRSMAQFGQEAIAGMAIVARLNPVAFGVIFALSGAVGPILGQNYGAGDTDRVRRGFNAAILFTALVIAGVSTILFILRAPIAGLFEATGITRDLVYLFCGPLALAFFFNGVLFVCNAAFNNLGHPFYSTFTNWARNTVFLIPLVMLGAGWLDAPGVLIGQSAAGVVMGIVAWIMAHRLIGSGAPGAGKPSEFARQGRLMALLDWRR